MAEGAALEMRCAGNRTEGSNPSRSVVWLGVRKIGTFIRLLRKAVSCQVCRSYDG